MGAITSASEGWDAILFGTTDGLRGYDLFDKRLSTYGHLNAGLPSRQIYQVFEDPFTRGIWVVHGSGISFRWSLDDHWRQVPSVALPDFFKPERVTRLGGSSVGIWLDMDGVYTLLNNFTGAFISRDTALPPDEVTWNTSRYDFPIPPTLTNWMGSDDWMTTITSFEGPGHLTAQPLFKLEDRNRNVWYGTDLGILFRGDLFTFQMTALPTGIAPQPVTVAYLDKDRVWFADNSFRRSGVETPKQEEYFLTSWDEQAGQWRHYSGLQSESIVSTGVNTMLRVGRELWLATMEGILILHTRSGDWRYLGSRAGLSDRAVWDLELFRGDVFAATTRGVDRIDPKKYRVMAPDTLNRSPVTEVYDLHRSDKTLLAGTAIGVYEYKGKKSMGWRRLSRRVVTSIWQGAGPIYAADGHALFRQDRPGEEFELVSFPVPISGRIVGMRGYKRYIWLATTDGVAVYDEKGEHHAQFNHRNGLPDNMVYDVLPTKDWVWFVTRSGVARFDWKTYFD